MTTPTTSWTPRPRTASEPACWSWTVPPLLEREAEIARQLAESESTGNPDDRLTRDVIEALLDYADPRWEAFHDRCAICGRDGHWERADGLVQDHCHETGQVRGWLCRSCNVREGTSGHILFTRYRLWHPAAILDAHNMYSGRGWSQGWPGGPRLDEPATRPATPWPAWDDAWTRDDFEPAGR